MAASVLIRGVSWAFTNYAEYHTEGVRVGFGVYAMMGFEAARVLYNMRDTRGAYNGRTTTGVGMNPAGLMLTYAIGHVFGVFVVPMTAFAMYSAGTVEFLDDE